jgi:hypothetical protein
MVSFLQLSVANAPKRSEGRQQNNNVGTDEGEEKVERK